MQFVRAERDGNEGRAIVGENGRGVGADEFKRGMGHRAGAVAVVTSRSDDQVHGMTMTDWAGVSVDPPLLLVCCDKKSNTHQVIAAGGCFAINVLRRDQEALSNLFASKKQEWERFDGLATESGATGAPLLPDSLVSFDCRVEAAHEAGDHWIYVGLVESVDAREGEPLLHFAGQYRGLRE